MQIGEKIRLLRTESKLTQNELAQKLNVSNQAVSNWERSKGYPDISNIIRLSDIFNVSLDELIKEDVDFKEQLLIKKYENKLDIIVNCIFFVFGVVGIVYELNRFLENKNFSDTNFFILGVAAVMFINAIIFLIKKLKK